MNPETAQSRFGWIVLGLFLTVVVMLGALGVVSADILSSVRAFVGGESLWSKGQKDAVYQLARYTASHQESDYRNFLNALAVPLGDRKARTELERSEPDLDLVRRGFLEGGNHADDIPGMIRLYRRFRNVRFMADAIDIWAEGDLGIAELRELADDVHARMTAGDTGSPELRALLDHLPKLNNRLTVLEQRFAETLGEASRIARQIVFIATLALGAVLAFGGMAIILRMLRSQARVERALRESNERFALAATAANIGVVDWDVERERIAIDVRAGALYGLKLDRPRVIRASLSQAVTHPDDLPALRTALQRAIGERSPLALRYRVLLPDGSVRHLVFNARASDHEPGAKPRIVGILSDESDHVQAEQLRLDKASAERANRAKTEFLSRVSHELRTPLNAILGFAQLMEADTRGPLSSAQGVRIGHVLASGQHLLRLIDDVLEVSSIEQGAVMLAVRDLDLVPLLRSCVERVEPLATAQRVRLVCTLPDGGASMPGDPLRLEQVFVNLLSNAIKYNRPDGLVEVSLHSEPAVHAIAVRDTGIGLSAQQVAKLFQPFNRLGAEYSKVAGSGLGLVITHQLIERMGGTLRVNSEPGEGSTFTVRLPSATPSAAGV